MVFSCSWPAYASEQPNFKLLKKVCNMWRNYGDIDDSWEDVKSITNWFVQNQNSMQAHAGPGHWNDPDTVKYPIDHFYDFLTILK
jgi:Alpha galactosidase A